MVFTARKPETRRQIGLRSFLEVLARLKLKSTQKGPLAKKYQKSFLLWATATKTDLPTNQQLILVLWLPLRKQVQAKVIVNAVASESQMHSLHKCSLQEDNDPTTKTIKCILLAPRCLFSFVWFGSIPPLSIAT